ncbi:metallophosphoesterase [Flavobacterium suncheonense]|uniref:Phosphoesterase n=1 Tax=Flavobacterium suncheonense GH29-5 = DSM 17707 TaxID=1121899 RepID=A0A0A2MAW4_9FLAO|nr:metallophosphoesterase [Flavobacterium suncheonense]KGO89802.1 phosphoesterase [Flavobacterium suncheonense GH29-5 = DSM 17707]
MTMRLVFIGVILLLVELYAYQAIKTITRERWILIVYQVLSLMAFAYILYGFSQFDRKVGQNAQSLFTIGLFLLMLVPKLLMAVILLSEDVFRMFATILNYFTQSDSIKEAIPERRKFISQIALGIAAIPFTSLLYGMTKGKYNFKVIRQTLFFPDLPESFDGMTITQFSDVHSGSFDNPEKIAYAIDLINAQKSDIILFTGDIVNTHATEMHPWIETFKKIETPKFGKYSILGNHDYGEYVDWDYKKDKEDNFNAIKDLHRQIDFKLLLNENVKLKNGADEIALIGVENWGVKFKQAGDLAKASEGVKKEDFKILMSHDPSHWDAEVQHHENNYHLTLSGHTHGLQFGIEIPGVIKWSPVQYVYKYWAGLYENMGRYIYVNRGFGFHAYPGRVGIWPEITVIQLKKGERVA